MKKLMLLLIVAASAAWGCNAAKVTGTAGDSKAPAADPKAAVVDASRKFIALKSLTGNIDADGPTPFKQRVEYAGPDRYRVSYRDDAGAQLEMIMAGDKSYVREGEKWNEMSGDTNPSPTMRNSFTDEVLQTISDAKAEGEETVNGKPASIYSYKLVTKVGSFPVTQKIWVDKDSGLPVKCYVEYTEGNIKTLTTTFDTQTPVTIELPAK